MDADPTTLKLYVRAAPQDLDQVRALIERLEGSGEEGGSTSTLRFIPMTGNAAVSAVEMAERLWRGPNQIRMTTPSETGPGIFDLREISPEEPARPKTPSQAPSAKPRVTTTKQTATQPEPNQPAAEPSRDKVTVDNDPPYVESRIPIHFASLQAVDETQDTAQSDTPQENAAPAVSPATHENATPAPSPTPQENAAPAAAAETLVPAPGKGSDIHIEFTSNGVLISSDDTKALDQFEEILRTVAGPQVLTPGKNFTVYFLKHCKADVARQLISDILGGSTGDGGAGGSLVGDVASNLMGGGGGILGALLGGGGGGDGGGVTTLQATGPVAMVADTRLNCLVVQALPVDTQLIEQLLKVIDREGSITDIETAGKPHIIPIVYVQAEQAASIVREAFSGRMATAGGQAGGQPNPLDVIRALRGGRGGRGGTETKSEEAKMTITVDNRSNSLIVTAPEPLYEQVKELVALIDQGSPELDESIQIVSLKKSNPETVQRALAAIMGTTTSSQTGSNRSQFGQRQGNQFGMPFGAATSGGGAIHAGHARHGSTAGRIWWHGRTRGRVSRHGWNGWRARRTGRVSAGGRPRRVPAGRRPRRVPAGSRWQPRRHAAGRRTRRHTRWCGRRPTRRLATRIWLLTIRRHDPATTLGRLASPAFSRRSKSRSEGQFRIRAICRNSVSPDGFNLPGPDWEGLNRIPSYGDCQMLWCQKTLVMSVAALLFLTCVCGAEAQGRRNQGPGQQPGGPGGPPQVVRVADLAVLGGPGGMGGFFGGGMSDIMILTREDVQKELELVDDQIEQLVKLRDNNDMREMFGQIRDLPQEERAAKMREVMEASQAKIKKSLSEILLPHQAERLKQLTMQWQMRGGGGLAASEDVAKELGISDDQREKLRTKARELERVLRKKLLEDLLKELTPEQQAKYKELVGEPFEFQQDDRFGPGRGGQFGPGGPGGGRGAGGRRGGN